MPMNREWKSVQFPRLAVEARMKTERAGNGSPEDSGAESLALTSGRAIILN
jgi:hypothetical protein